MKRAKNRVRCVYLKKKAKGPDLWVWRRRLEDSAGIVRHCSTVLGTVVELPTVKHAGLKRDELLGREAAAIDRGPTVRDAVEAYKISNLPHVRHSTRSAYLSQIKQHILPLWGDVALSEVKTLAIENALNGLKLSKKTKLHLKWQWHILFLFAMKAEMFPASEVNPIEAVTIRGVNRRRRKKHDLTPEQFKKLFGVMDLRLQTMASLACCNGLSASEFLGLQWPDIDFKAGVLMVARSVTGRHVEDTKTEARAAEVVMAPQVVALLMRWKESCPVTADAWVFPNPDTGRPWHADSLRSDHLHKAGKTIGIPNLGWHSFRHSYRTLIDEAGTPAGIMMHLMRHSNVSQTMKYGTAQRKAKQKANRKVAGRLLQGLPVSPAVN